MYNEAVMNKRQKKFIGNFSEGKKKYSKPDFFHSTNDMILREKKYNLVDLP